MGRGLAPALVAGLLLLPAGLPRAAPEKPNLDAQIAQLASVRERCIAAARTVQQKDRTLAALDLAIGVMERGAAAEEERLRQNGKAEEQLLGALERLALAPPEALAFAPEGPIDRIRSGILIAAAVPALQTQAKQLSGALASLAAVRAQISARRPELEAARQALANARDALATLIARRADLIGGLLPDGTNLQAVDRLGDVASDLFDLIKRADAEADRRDLQTPVHLRAGSPPPKKGVVRSADPTRPADLRALDASRATMIWPAAGDVVHRFGEADRYGRPSQGVTIGVAPSSVVVAPFDGQVDYVGRFRDYGLILIIRHGGGYHSLLAGLVRVDVTSGQWLLAGEPIGATAGTDDQNASATLYMELRRDGRPVDPQSRLASRDEKAEDSKVHQ